ncbi:MAG: hypothetical protein ACFFCW_47095 [Candidatus Hodarchaeota archaeon]
MKWSITMSAAVGLILIINGITIAQLEVIDFENVPTTYHWVVGNQNIDGYYPNLNFGPDATILDKGTGGYNYVGYPPHSGNAVLFSYDIPWIRVDFANTTDHVEVWYTSDSDFYFEAYNTLDVLLATVVGSANTTTNSFLFIDSPEIAYVVMHDTGNFFTIDDFGYNASHLVGIDIKPMSCPNPLNVKSNGVLPVAILGTEDFDVSDVDVSSVSLAGIAPIRFDYEDVATPFDGELCDCHELGPDGYLDLILKFDTQEIVDALGSVLDGDELELILTGECVDGIQIEGSDCIRIIKKSQD